MASDSKGGANQRALFDPFTTFCFELEIEGIVKPKSAFFKSVSGLNSESEVVAFVEGGLNVSTRQLPGPIKWPNLVLKRGFTKDTALIDWRQEWLNDSPGRQLKRRNGKIVQLDRQLKAVCSWHFVAGWPCKWQGPEYDASKNELAIESIEIAHEGLTYKKG